MLSSGYETIGLFAPIMVVLGRLCQGFAAGVELGGVSVYPSEIATGSRAMSGAWPSLPAAVALIAIWLTRRAKRQKALEGFDFR